MNPLLKDLLGLALVITTGYYAFLTLRLSKSARLSAQFAQEAAQAAALSARLQLSTVDVNFDITVDRSAGSQESQQNSLTVKCTGANVWLHTMVVDQTMRVVALTEEWSSLKSGVPLRLEGDGPRFIQRGEIVKATLGPSQSLMTLGTNGRKHHSLNGLRVVISFSFDPKEPATSKAFLVRL